MIEINKPLKRQQNMKNLIYILFAFLLVGNLSAQEVLNEGRANDAQAKKIITQKINESGTVDEGNSYQDDPNAPVVEPEEDVFYPVNLDQLKAKIRNSAESDDVAVRMNDLSQQVYDLVLFNEQLRLENQDIRRSLEQCCKKGSKNDLSFLVQNAPNPFTEFTKVDYYLNSDVSNAEITIRSMDGKVVKAIEILESGYGSIEISANDLQDGFYIYTLYNDTEVIDSKVLVLTK